MFQIWVARSVKSSRLIDQYLGIKLSDEYLKTNNFLLLGKPLTLINSFLTLVVIPRAFRAQLCRSSENYNITFLLGTHLESTENPHVKKHKTYPIPLVRVPFSTRAERGEDEELE